MSKVICDVCGTTYPETSSVCPICGCAKNTTAQTAADSVDQSEMVSSYTYVKGGRFSKSNVKKRNKKTGNVQRVPEQMPEPEQDKASKALIAVVLILILAIIAVLVYIGLKFFAPKDNSPEGTRPSTEQTDSPETTDGTEPNDPIRIPCTAIKLSNTTIELSEKGSAWLLSVDTEPANTSDAITFTSADERVATVSDKGNIEAIGGGETVITVTCGDQTAECKIVCTFGEPVEPTDEPTVPPVDVPAGYQLKLKYSDITISTQYPEPVPLFRDTDSVKATDITWTVDDPKVASVDEKGVVSPVGKGNTVVHAKLGDQTASCKVIVSFEPTSQPEAQYKISKSDVTIKVGESFRLTLSTAEGADKEVEWIVNEEGYVEIDGKNIKGIQPTAELKNRYVTISATVEDITYSCIVRVTEAEDEKAES